MRERPLVIRACEPLDVELLGSVHALYRNVPLILEEIGRRSPGFVAAELTDPNRLTGSMDVDAVIRHFGDRLVCLDRRPAITSRRYLCDTPPGQYLKECLYRFAVLPFNAISIVAYNRLYGLYRLLFDGWFFSFGWSREDARRYIYERDEYMAAKLIGHIRERRRQGHEDSYVVVVGRRHVPGMAAILHAYAITGDVGSYYAGGRVLDVFSIKRLEEPYTVSREEASNNLTRNAIIESLAKTVLLPVYLLALFIVLVAIVTLIAIAIVAITGI